MEKFVERTKEHFKKMCSSGRLFRANISGREIYQFYLMAFPDGTNPVFRDPSSSTHNCNNCNNFIKRYGNIVSVNENGELVTLFGADGIPEPHATVAKQLDTLIKARAIENVFFETFAELNSLNYEKCRKGQDTFRLGIAENHKRYTEEEAAQYGVVNTTDIYKFVHLHVDLPKAFVDHSGDSVEKIMATYRDKYNVFKRAMEEIPLDVLVMAKDLINQGSLLDGTAHLHAIEEMILHKTHYDQVPAVSKETWCWVRSYGLDTRTSKFGNTLVGEFCYEIASGVELNKACENFNKRVDPANYMKAKAPITKRQIEEAQKFVTENGLLESFDRRFATPDDINVNDIKHVSTEGKVKPVTMFDKLKPTTAGAKEMKFDKVEEIPIEKFMADILPGCTSVEVLLQNRHEGNLVALTTSKNTDSKPIFKWANNFSWTFKGNLAGKSQIKEAVKTKGGKVDGVLRFSIMWAEGDPSDNSDLDAWCKQPNGKLIGFRSKTDPSTGGNLDVDITNPQGYHNKNIVENITWPDIKRMPNGTYKFWVNQFSNRGSKGFKAEIEFNGTIYSYEYNRPVSGDVHVAEVTLKDGQFSIVNILPSSESSKEVWGLQTNEFHRVNLVSLSPNHWGENAVGNKHYFFMLDGAKPDVELRSFHNENLQPELLQHRKVLEVLGAKSMIKPEGKTLAGLGFNSTVKDEVIVKLAGTFNRTVKIKF